ncbi:uncharacterized protein PRCAT00000460001 [Priceomyces carsonii]|uniref:uncharacterized protein n=1 Tax=Priceomyces carsonii TaxID=28549 RepID=UPI002ED7A7C6|nr:unnamed protein product [Priceomyces carsonii]
MQTGSGDDSHDLVLPTNLRCESSSSQLSKRHQLSKRNLETRYETEEPHLDTTFPYSLTLKVQTSEPRDILQLERTCLSFIRFTTALFFTALGIILNFKIDSSNDGGGSHKLHHSYSAAISFLVLILAAVLLIVSLLNYLTSVDRYATGKIKTYRFNNLHTVIIMTGVVLAVTSICIILIIEEYISSF